MEKDRIRWNEKYLKYQYSDKPSEIVKKFYHFADKGKALDIAAGTGRNAVFLAKQGFITDAVDISDIAFSKIDAISNNINLICADLDNFDIPEKEYNLILNVKFLNRRLFPYIKQGLVPGGILIFETYLESAKNMTYASNRDYLLRENELLHAFLSLKILFYQETKDDEDREIASLVAMRINYE